MPMLQVLKLAFALLALALLAGCAKPRAHYADSWPEPRRCTAGSSAGVVYFQNWVTDPAKAVCEPIDAFGKILDSAYQYVQNTGAVDNLIVFIHGRGKHPQKLIEENLMSRLQSENSAAVIAVHWPSYAGPLGYADTSARAAARDLEAVMRAYASHRRATLDAKRALRTTLLVHSMGNILFRAWALQADLSQYDDTLFDTVIQNAADIPPSDLGPWLADMRLSRQHYVTVNRDDRVLQASQWLFGQGERLGRCMPRTGRPDHIHFFDFTATDVGHRYYVGRRRSAGVTLFYERLLDGRALPVAEGVDRRWYDRLGERGRTYAVTRDGAKPTINWCSG
ncbi:MAG: alpha/beta hydrolase [Pseudomonadota bacterium]